MGWLHTFNLKRKLIGALTEHRSSPQTVAALARHVNFPVTEVVSLLDEMERKGLVIRSRLGGAEAYQLNQSQQTVARLMRALTSEQPEDGMTLLQDEHGWVAELTDPAGLLVRGETRE
jgi:DNA-binding IclR family transcriptional regulator